MQLALRWLVCTLGVCCTYYFSTRRNNVLTRTLARGGLKYPSRGPLQLYHDPLDHRRIGRLQDWIDRCLSSHTRCSAALTTQTFVPTRLVELHETNPDTIRLVSPVEPVQYIALSYC